MGRTLISDMQLPQPKQIPDAQVRALARNYDVPSSTCGEFANLLREFVKVTGEQLQFLQSTPKRAEGRQNAREAVRLLMKSRTHLRNLDRIGELQLRQNARQLAELLDFNWMSKVLHERNILVGPPGELFATIHTTDVGEAIKLRSAGKVALLSRWNILLLRELLRQLALILEESAKPRPAGVAKAEIFTFSIVNMALLFELAGKRPTSTRNGPFERFCEDIFDSVGWNLFADRLPSAIKPALRQYRRRLDQ